MWWLTCNDNTRTSGRCTSFKYSWWWALSPETCRVTLQKQKPAQCCIKLVFHLTYKKGFYPACSMMAYKGSVDIAAFIVNLCTRWSEWLTWHSNRLTRRKEPSIHIKWEAGWAQSKSGWFGEEKILLPVWGFENKINVYARLVRLKTGHMPNPKSSLTSWPATCNITFPHHPAFMDSSK